MDKKPVPEGVSRKESLDARATALRANLLKRKKKEIK
jgi:hypothetical protein